MNVWPLAFLAPGGGEMLVVLLALLLLFGPKDAPRILRKGLDLLRRVQRSATRFKNELLSVPLDPETRARSRDTTVYDREQRAARPPPPPPPPGNPPP